MYMKRFTKYLSAIAVCLFYSQMLMAGNITIKYQKDGVPSTENSEGVVACEFVESNTKVIITATPKNGYYLTLAQISVTKSVDSHHANTRTGGVDINPAVEVRNHGTNADRTATTKYEFDVADANLDYEVTANFCTRTTLESTTGLTIDVIDESTKQVELNDVDLSVSGSGTAEVVIPAVINVGGVEYAITSIASNTLAGKTGVTDIYLPNTDVPIKVSVDALKIDNEHVATVHVPLQLLADYAKMQEIKQNFEAGKIVASFIAPARYWTFSCGIDVQVPNGVRVYTCHVNKEGNKVILTELTDDVLGGVIKANNGVLLSGEIGEYAISASPAVTIATSYPGNQLEPVLKDTHYEPGQYFVLYENEFHPILDNNSKAPACKAVLHKTSY